MNYKFKKRITSALRKLSFSWPPRGDVLRRAKIAPATYECELCNAYVYDGSSDKSFKKVSESLSKPVSMGKVYVDHIEPIVPLQGFSRGDWDWDDYIKRMFCDIEGLQAICKPCHDEKTNNEKKIKKALTSKKKSCK